MRKSLVQIQVKNAAFEEFKSQDPYLDESSALERDETHKLPQEGSVGAFEDSKSGGRFSEN